MIRQGRIGGGESHVYELVKNINRDLFETVILSFSNGQMIKNIDELGIRCHVIDSQFPFDIRIWPKVSKLIKRENIQIVHAHGTRALSNVLYISKKNKIPVIYTIHGWSFHDDQKWFRRSVSIFLERYFTSSVNVNISVSKTNQNTGKKVLRNFDSAVIRNGVNLDKFNTQGKFKDIRKEFGIPNNCTLVGYFVRITKQKDPLTLIRAYNKISQKYSDIHLLIIGEGDLKNEMVKLTKEYGLELNVHFDNFREDMPDLLNAIDIYCLPSLWEGLSIGLLEAMAMRKAIIATRVDGTIEVIQDKNNGILINPGDADMLSEAIITLHIDKKMSDSLAQNAFDTVYNGFSIKQTVSNIEHIYSNLISQK